MAQPDRVFLDWSLPTAAGVARWLIASAPALPAVDLSGTLVFVPTRQAARRLREELAKSASAGVLAPQTFTPSQFLRLDAGDALNEAGCIAVFLDVFGQLDAPSLAALFPNGIPFRTFEERASFARTFLTLRTTLTDANWTLRAAAQRLGDHADAERWQALAALEHAFLSALRLVHQRDIDTARLEFAAHPRISPEIHRVILAGVADLPPLAERALAALPADIAFHSLIPAPHELADGFDAWGRPLSAFWNDRDPGWDDFNSQVHLCARAEDVAATLTAILPASTAPDPGFLEIGALDRELLPTLRAAIDGAGGSLHDPEGQSLDRHWLGLLMGEWAGFLTEPTFAHATAFLRNGVIATWLAKKLKSFDLDDALGEAHRIQSDHFPSSVESAQARCQKGRSLERGLAHLLALRDQLAGRDWMKSLRSFLEEISDEESEAVATAIFETLDSLAPLIPRHTDLSPPDWLLLARAQLAARFLYPDAAASAIEASGWLELPWSDAPHLVLAGFNQGIVPAPFAQDPFLTAAIRQQLEIPNEEQRQARDAFLLARLLAMRRGGAGRVDALVCQIDSEGTPRQPSSLLFGGSGEELPERVHRLFAEPRAAEADPPWESSWLLEPQRIAFTKPLRVTAFREYLACPFEFYLRFVLEMEPFDPDPAEMDARVFGSLVHDAIEIFSRDTATRDLADADAIFAVVSDLLDAAAESRFETPLSLPLLVQVESARQRLRAFAELQAMQRREGWRIIHAEISFSELLGNNPWLVDGREIRGKIDRIDVHDATGRWRVLDYKTSDKADAPDKAHLRGGATAGWPPGYAFAETPGKWWTNLQLPLYRQLLIEAGHENVACGYFNLPKRTAEASVAEWTAFDDALGESALRCARGVLADVARGHFWPPNPKARYPQNAGLFHPDPDRTVAPDSWIREALP